MNLVSKIISAGGIFLLCITISGCTKEEGPGGTSTIKGKVIVHDFDSDFQEDEPLRIYPAPDQKVYIIYGEDGTTYNDDFNTSYDGTYEFKYLQKGKYKIFAYSKDSTHAPTGLLNDLDVVHFVDVEITSNGSEVSAPDLIILDNDGH